MLLHDIFSEEHLKYKPRRHPVWMFASAAKAPTLDPIPRQYSQEEPEFQTAIWLKE